MSNEFKPANKIYTEKEASEYLKISLTTLWRLRKQRKIKYLQIITNIRYTQEHLDEFIQSQTVGNSRLIRKAS